MMVITKKEINEVLNKEVKIILGDEDDTFSFKGKIISYVEDNNQPHKFTLHTIHGSIKEFDFKMLKSYSLA